MFNKVKFDKCNRFVKFIKFSFPQNFLSWYVLKKFQSHMAITLGTGKFPPELMLTLPSFLPTLNHPTTEFTTL